MNYNKFKENILDIQKDIIASDIEMTKKEEALKLTQDLTGLLDRALGLKTSEELKPKKVLEVLRVKTLLNYLPGKKLALSDSALRGSLASIMSYEQICEQIRGEKKSISGVDDYFDFMSASTELPKKKEKTKRRGNDKVRASLFKDEYLAALKKKAPEDWRSLIVAEEVAEEKLFPDEKEPEEDISLEENPIPEEVSEPKEELISESELAEALELSNTIVGAKVNNPEDYFTQIDKSIASESSKTYNYLADEPEVLGKTA